MYHKKQALIHDMGLLITFAILLTVLSFASVLVIVPSVEEISIEENNSTTEVLTLEDTNEVANS